MSNTVFHDCLGREIKVGDVVAYGYRDGNYGAVCVGVVRGFENDKILATKFSRGRWCVGVDKPWWMPDADGKSWRTQDGYWGKDKQCFITGMTEADLRAIIGLVKEREESQCVGRD